MVLLGTLARLASRIHAATIKIDGQPRPQKLDKARENAREVCSARWTLAPERFAGSGGASDEWLL